MTRLDSGQRAALELVAASAAEDVTTCRGPGGTPWYDDRRIGRMLARDPVIAEFVPLALEEIDRLGAQVAARDAALDACQRRIAELLSELAEMRIATPGAKPFAVDEIAAAPDADDALYMRAVNKAMPQFTANVGRSGDQISDDDVIAVVFFRMVVGIGDEVLATEAPADGETR